MTYSGHAFVLVPYKYFMYYTTSILRTLVLVPHKYFMYYTTSILRTLVLVPSTLVEDTCSSPILIL